MNPVMSAQQVLIFVSNELGVEILKYFKEQNWWALVIDTHDNSEADATVIIPEELDFVDKEQAVIMDVRSRLGANAKLDAIVCISGRCANGNLRVGLAGTTELMWRHSVHSSVIASCLAAHFLKDGGLLLLTGANSALNGSPKNMAYGMAKAAVHHLVTSLGTKGSGMPKESCCIGIILTTLNTISNRISRPYADITKWTPLKFIAELCYKWSCNKERPATGSLLRLITQNSETSIISI
ncbi:hypothetical protein FQA39_LY04055 [Lamprigera yunnana]|nr:hypothetical protein FQA39_LY04055 [Lamprigera yunnana]